MQDSLSHYCCKGYKEVEGWLYPPTIKCIRALSGVQKEAGIKGNMCEIGIHHGRLFILLHLLANSDEHSIACDLFERQDENISLSGQGNREKLIENLKKNGGDFDRIEIITKNSRNLSPDELLTYGGLRMISVDGGHDAETAYNDIKLAGETIVDGGIIWLDDFPNEGCPGVMEALYRYLFQTEDELWPVAILERKLLLTNSEGMARMYMNQIIECLNNEFDILNSIMVGKRILILWEKSPRKRLKRYLQQRKLWKRLQNYKLMDELGKILNKYM